MITTAGDKKKYKFTHRQKDEVVDSPCLNVCAYDEEIDFWGINLNIINIFKLCPKCFEIY